MYSRQLVCLWRGISPTPKRLLFVAAVLSLCYVGFFISDTTPQLSLTRTNGNAVKDLHSGVASNRGDVHADDTLRKEDAIELEHDRQTLNFLNLADNTQSPSTLRASPLVTGEDGKCPEVEDLPDLRGPLPQAVLLIQNLMESEVSAIHPELGPGGAWAPKDCKARYKVAIIIPYRDRQSHLTRLLAFLIPILQRQRLDFRFIVTEQYGNDLFNKGKIMNAAFMFAEKLGVDCVVFHDVDMFPQDDRNPYSCPTQPRHLGAFVNNLGYQLWYKEIVGGILALTMDDYRKVNGYSNMYWAWGGEDDDMGKRIMSLNYTIERPDNMMGRYSMLKHVKRQRTAPKLIYKLLDNSDQRVPTDGLNQKNQWTVRKMTVRPLYYHLFVDVGPVPEEWRAHP